MKIRFSFRASASPDDTQIQTSSKDKKDIRTERLMRALSFRNFLMRTVSGL